VRAIRLKTTEAVKREQGRGFPECALILRAAVPHQQRESAMDSPENQHTLRLPEPDPDLKLTPEERADVRRGFDVDALERLLAAVEADVRPIILDWFRAPKRVEGEPGVWETPPITTGDPALQPLLDEVWATAWERYPQLLDNDEVIDPGKDIAKERRAMRERQK
jgi:hypothetical protein